MSEVEKIISNLRACLLSTKGGIALHALERDYKTLIGHNIPFRQLGHATLEQFLRSLPNMTIFTGPNGELMFDAVPMKESDHLAALIAKQKSAPKRMRCPLVQRRPITNQRRQYPINAQHQPQKKLPPLEVTITQQADSQTHEDRMVRLTQSQRNLQQNARPKVWEKAPRYKKSPSVLNRFQHASAVKLPTSSKDCSASSSEQNQISQDLGSFSNISYALQTPIREQLRKARRAVPPVIEVDQTYFQQGKEYSRLLSEYAQQNGLEQPTYRMVPRQPKGEPALYSCVVKLGSYSYNSYPDERTQPEQALELAASNALNDLKKFATKQMPDSGDCTIDKNLIMRRISEIVSGHRSGLFTSQVPEDYYKLHNEYLPQNWLDLATQCPNISMETVAGDRKILVPFSPFQSPTTSNSVKMPVLPELKLPDEGIWDVYVTTAVSTKEVWIRLIGDAYSLLYENMTDEMEKYYPANKRKVDEAEKGQLFVVENDSSWHRVQVLEVVDGEASVFFVDHGDEDFVPLSRLYVLEPRFGTLPSQATVCSLAGMEAYEEDPHAVELLLDNIIGKSFVAEILTNTDNKSQYPSIVLYDTSTDEDINVNQILTDKIISYKCTPHLPQGDVCDVMVSHVEDTGGVYVQVDSFGIEILNEQMASLDMSNSFAKACDIKRTPQQLYLAMYSADNCYYRAVIEKEPDSSKEVEVRFVDYGNTEIVKLNELLVVDSTHSELLNLPFQALKVYMHTLPPSVFNEKVASRLRQVIPEDEHVLLKVIVPACNNNPAEVELFKRITEDKLLVSINTTLALDQDLFKAVGKHSENVRNKKRLERLQSLSGRGDVVKSPEPNNNSDDGLLTPYIPDKGCMFDVHVTMASNPGNFVIQPHLSNSDLLLLMDKLQCVYTKKPYPLLTPDDIVEGGLLAGLHSDGSWYRVKATNLLNNIFVSVYFCDFGGVSVMSLENLQPLEEEFKVIPYQAIKAKLSSIKAVHGDWSVDDCLEFQKMVVGKQFVALVQHIDPNVASPSDKIVGLRLINTSSSRDIYIDQELVDQKRAIFIN